MHSNTSLVVLAAGLGVAMAQTTVTINPATTYQTMDGFGFSEAFGFGTGVQNAPAAQQSQALDLMFSTTKGAGFTILRNRIAADPGDTIEPNSPGSPSGTPKYTWNGNDESQVFWSTQARARGVKYIYADAWSAPGYMKTTGSYENGGYLCGVTGETCSSGDWRQAYANYLVQYIKDYESAGITIDFIGFLNEPEYAASYDAMLSDGTKAASFITVLHATIAAAGLSTQINCCDAEGWNDQVTYTSQLIAAGVEPLLGRITSHFYTSQGSSPINTKLRVWETEYCDLNDAFSTTWHNTGAMNEGFYWAKLLYQGVVGANLSGFLYWVGAQSNSNAAGLVTLTGSGSSTVVTASGSLWAFAMWSRYIRPDAVRIGTSGSPSGVETAAFKNTNGNIVVILTNTGGSSSSVTISGTGATSVSGYVMDNSVSQPSAFTSSLSGGNIGATLPAYSVVTFVITTGNVVVSSSSSTTASSTLRTSTTTSATTSSSPPTGSTVAEWGQCGGISWTGSTACASPYVCTALNPYYSQCLSG